MVSDFAICRAFFSRDNTSSAHFFPYQPENSIIVMTDFFYETVSEQTKTIVFTMLTPYSLIDTR